MKQVVFGWSCDLNMAAPMRRPTPCKTVFIGLLMTTVFISVECTLFSHFTKVLFIYLFLSKIILTILTHCFREHCAEIFVQVLSGFWLSSYVKTSEFTNWHKTLWNPCMHWERGRDGYVVQQAYDGKLLFTSLLYLYFWVAALGLPTGSVHILPWGLWAGPRIWALQTTAPV